MKRWGNILWVAMLLLLGGCGIGYDHTLFFTKTNVGVDIDDTPPTLEASISRREGVITPSFDKGQVLPVMASFRYGDHCLMAYLISKIIGTPEISISSTFSSGDAAATMSYLFNDKDGTKSDIQNAELEIQQSKSINKDLNNFTRLFRSLLPLNSEAIHSIEYVKDGEVKPLFFGTDTTTGLKVVYSGQGESLSVMKFRFGYHRKEFAYIPISFYTKDNKNYVNQPSLLATLDYNSKLPQINPQNTSTSKKSDDETSYVQYFAIGKAANNLALRQNVRKAMYVRMDPQLAQDFSETLDVATMLNEPSGLCPSGITGKEKPFALAVHDETPYIYIIQRISSFTDKDTKEECDQGLTVNRKILRFIKPDGNEYYEKEDIDDLEAITYDAKNDRYFAITSHRKTPEKSEESEKSPDCVLIRFKIDKDKWNDPSYNIRPDNVIEKSSILEFIKNYLDTKEIKDTNFYSEIEKGGIDLSKLEKQIIPL